MMTLPKLPFVSAPPPPVTLDAVEQYGRVELSPHTGEVWINGTAVHLSATEFRLLYILAVNTGRVLSRDQLSDYAICASGSIGTFFSLIRRKTGLPIVGIRGYGWKLELQRKERCV